MARVPPHLEIAGRWIGSRQAPYVVCELSANHNGDIETAFKLMEAGKKAGADAIKLQTYTPATMTLDSDTDEFIIKGGLWHGRQLYELYQEAHTPWDWHKPLFERAHELEITIFSTPFDNTAVDLLEELNTPAYKVASFEVTDLPLIRYIATTGKPMIISTGMANDEEINEAVQTARDSGCREMVLLHCVSAYPAPPADYNLATLPDMARRFGAHVGLSDHTQDNATAIAAIALGACMIEKHFTLDRSGGGPDDSFSLEPEDFSSLCRDVKTAWQALGKVDYGRKSSEQGNVTFRRSLYFVKNLSAGDVVTPDAIRSVRPGHGLPPKYLDKLIGMRVTRDVAANTATHWDFFETTT